MERNIHILIGLLVAGLATGAGAATIVVDPGPVGTSSSTITMPFGDLNGEALAGQTFDLDFVFADMKHIAPSLSGPNFYNVQIIFDTNVGGPPGVPPATASGYLSDENGDPVATPLVASAGETGSGSFRYTLNFDRDDVDGVEHHDIHFEDIVFPTNAAGQVTGGSLELTNNDSNTTLTVGEGGQVPEPSGITLLVVGLAGMGAYVRRRRAA